MMNQQRAGELDNANSKPCANKPSYQGPQGMNNRMGSEHQPAILNGEGNIEAQLGSVTENRTEILNLGEPFCIENADCLNLDMVENDRHLSWRRRAQSTEDGPLVTRDSDQTNKRPIQLNGYAETTGQDECGNRKRRTRSEGDEGVAAVWRSLEDGPVLICPHAARDSTREDSNDMEQYFQANAHLLAHMDLDRGGLPRHDEKDSSEDSGKEDEGDYDDIVDSNELAAATKWSTTSSEDQGDFIETDFCAQQLRGDSQSSSTQSSTEDIPRLAGADNNTHCPGCSGNMTDLQWRECEHLCSYANCDGREADRPRSLLPFSKYAGDPIQNEVFQYKRQSNVASSQSGHGKKHKEEGAVSASHYSPDVDVEYMDFDLDASSGDSHNLESASGPTPAVPPGGSHFGAVRRDSGVDEEQSLGSHTCLCASSAISHPSNNHGNHQNDRQVTLYNGTGARPRVPHHSNTLHTHPNSIDRTSSDEGALDMGVDLDIGHETNNLDLEGTGCNDLSDHEERLNVTRQTSTSNFDHDENNFQDEDEEKRVNCAECCGETCCSRQNLVKDENVYDLFLHNVKSGLYARYENNNYKHPLKPYGKEKLHSDLDLATPNRVDSLQPSVHHGLNNSEGMGTAPSSSHGDLPTHANKPRCSRPSDWPEEPATARGARNSRTWPQCSDDESPVSALRLLEYEFTEETDWRRRGLPRPSSFVTSDDDSPINAVRLLEYDFVSPSWSSDADDKANRSGSDELLEEDCGEEDGAEKRTDDQTAALVRDNNNDDDDHLSKEEKKELFVKFLQMVYEGPGVRSSFDSLDSKNCNPEKTMIWSEYEAFLLQVKQIGTSACGATAAINVLKVFEIYPDKEAVCKVIKTNLRDELAPIPEYLLSRSVAGTTAQCLIDGITSLTGDGIYGRFFPLFPEREVDLRQWLSYWIKKGAVPLLTLNLQKGMPLGWPIPDAWHHQMCYGVGPRGVYLTNPLEITSYDTVRKQLSSESVILVRRQDLINRWTDTTDLSPLMTYHPLWRKHNIMGQVINVLREASMSRMPGFRPQLTSHISIPAWYKSGVTLFVRRDTDVHKELLSVPDLPLKHEPNHVCNST